YRDWSSDVCSSDLDISNLRNSHGAFRVGNSDLFAPGFYHELTLLDSFPFSIWAMHLRLRATDLASARSSQELSAREEDREERAVAADTGSIAAIYGHRPQERATTDSQGKVSFVL